MPILSGPDHSRIAAGMTYVYSVMSRRAGGVSVGINLNPNNACNWRCIYCQVPALSRGAPPPVDLDRLESELGELLRRLITDGRGALAAGIEDVAFSGNGESTLAQEFPEAVERARATLVCLGLSGRVKLRLITNGSQVTCEPVRRGLRSIADAGGEVWFKVDGGSREAFARINDVKLDPAGVIRRLSACAGLVSTWVQSCFFATDGVAPSERDLDEFVSLLDRAGPRQLRGVLLYGLARQSMQPEASRLTRLNADDLERIAERIRKIGLTVRVSP